MSPVMTVVISALVAFMPFAASGSHAGQTTEDIDYQIMVQRATQAAIWAMPAVGMIDFEKATRRDLGGNVNDVVYVSQPFVSRHGFLTANDVTPYAWGSISAEQGPLFMAVPPSNDKVGYCGTIVNAWDVPLVDVGATGFEKGKPFKPDAEQKRAMLEGLELAYASMQSYFTTEGTAMVPLWQGKSQ